MESTELARLRRIGGRQTTRLTHYGRKTDKAYEVTIWFVLDGDKLYMGTANVKRQWVQNGQKTPQIELSIENENFKGTARFLSDRSEHERAMAAIGRKYWIFRPIIEFGRMLAGIGFMRDNTGSLGRQGELAKFDVDPSDTFWDLSPDGSAHCVRQVRGTWQSSSHP
jgi:deazaflavin-dependent oxidoreductase (nitroreductase family)